MWFFDVFEENGQIIVEGDVPGFEKDELAIFGDDSRLVLTGTRRSPEGARTYFQRERRARVLSREIPLPRRVDTEACEATLRDGVLQVRLQPAGHRGCGRFEIPLDAL